MRLRAGVSGVLVAMQYGCSRAAHKRGGRSGAMRFRHAESGRRANRVLTLRCVEPTAWSSRPRTDRRTDLGLTPGTRHVNQPVAHASSWPARRADRLGGRPSPQAGHTANHFPETLSAMTDWPVHGRISGPIVMIGFGSIGGDEGVSDDREHGDLR